MNNKSTLKNKKQKHIKKKKEINKIQNLRAFVLLSFKGEVSTDFHTNILSSDLFVFVLINLFLSRANYACLFTRTTTHTAKQKQNRNNRG